MPYKLLLRMIAGTHEFWYRLSGGLIGGRIAGLPILLLTTTGRKSGRNRTMPLVYLPDGDNMVVIASNGGADQHPAWWLNLRDNPTAEVQVGPNTKTVVAEKATGQERQRLWHEVVDVYHGYDEYSRMTSREIPVVILRPNGTERLDSRKARRRATLARK
jgi:deazaflavin-dependent oxidoreductase (nitroreductase family)